MRVTEKIESGEKRELERERYIEREKKRERENSREMLKTFLTCFLIITTQFKFLYKYLLLSGYFPISLQGRGEGGIIFFSIQSKVEFLTDFNACKSRLNPKNIYINFVRFTYWDGMVSILVSFFQIKIFLFFF